MTIVLNLVLSGQLLIPNMAEKVKEIGKYLSFKPCFIWLAPYTFDDQVYMTKWEAEEF